MKRANIRPGLGGSWLTLRLPLDALAQLRERAAAEDRPLSSMARLLVLDGLKTPRALPRGAIRRGPAV